MMLEPEPVTFAPEAAISSTIESSEVFFIVMNPDPTTTFSPNPMTNVGFTDTPDALFAGDSADTVGAVASSEVNVHVVAFAMPPNVLPDESTNVPEPTST